MASRAAAGPDSAIRAAGLRKSYGDVTAIAGIYLDIGRGEVFALLGPNGAGKTSTVEILEGFRRRDGGTVTVLGEDPGPRDGPGGPGSGSCCIIGGTTILLTTHYWTRPRRWPTGSR
jgi:Fe-S cluster assembly ATPase SufC